MQIGIFQFTLIDDKGNTQTFCVAFNEEKHTVQEIQKHMQEGTLPVGDTIAIFEKSAIPFYVQLGKFLNQYINGDDKIELTKLDDCGNPIEKEYQDDPKIIPFPGNKWLN